MSTAVQTRNNVATNSPIINVARTLTGAVVPEITAIGFTGANLRHIVNRRMRWSSTEQFVRQALVMLASAVNNRALGNASITPALNRVVDLVRDAANRRRAWVTVNDTITGAVKDLIEAARRCC